MMKKVTIRDIAERCGVTPTVVSAVLNGSGRRSRCSEEKQALILKTAEELNYRPNIFARSMVTNRVPLVLLMFHRGTEDIAYGSQYFAESVAGASAVLNKCGLETIVVFFRTPEEQVARLNDLIRKGIVGGVISHIAQNANREFIELLHANNIPHILDGEPEIPAVAVMPQATSGVSYFYEEVRQHYSAKKIFIHQAEGGRDVLFPYYDIPGYSRFHYETITPVPELTGDPENMIISLGYDFYNHLSRRMDIASPLVVERQEFEFMIPDPVPRVIHYGVSNYIADAAEILAKWQVDGVEPEYKIHYIPSSEYAELKWGSI